MTGYVDPQALEDLDKWSVDIFQIAELSNNQPLTCVMYNIFMVSASCIMYYLLLREVGKWPERVVTRYITAVCT